jgi:hypothetical protein
MKYARMPKAEIREGDGPEMSEAIDRLQRAFVDVRRPPQQPAPAQGHRQPELLSNDWKDHARRRTCAAANRTRRPD